MCRRPAQPRQDTLIYPIRPWKGRHSEAIAPCGLCAPMIRPVTDVNRTGQLQLYRTGTITAPQSKHADDAHASTYACSATAHLCGLHATSSHTVCALRGGAGCRSLGAVVGLASAASHAPLTPFASPVRLALHRTHECRCAACSYKLVGGLERSGGTGGAGAGISS